MESTFRVEKFLSWNCLPFSNLQCLHVHIGDCGHRVSVGFIRRCYILLIVFNNLFFYNIDTNLWFTFYSSAHLFPPHTRHNAVFGTASDDARVSLSSPAETGTGGCDWSERAGLVGVHRHPLHPPASYFKYVRR